ncbi:MAG TPA: hypothetical protein VHM25_04000, partial [Polyangiaceae bacterium]|nr:hypothetical protein [Polyangiaceae bacterium]
TAIEPEKRFPNALEMLRAIEEASAKDFLHARPHELASFMATHFGEAREEEQLQIKAALRGEMGSQALELSDSRQRVIPVSSASESARMSDEPVELQQLQSSRTFRVRHRGRNIAAAAAVLAALGGVGVWALRSSAPTPAPVSVAQPAPPKTVLFEVQALPAGAEIVLDGKLLGTNRFAGPQPSPNARCRSRCAPVVI